MQLVQTAARADGATSEIVRPAVTTPRTFEGMRRESLVWVYGLVKSLLSDTLYHLITLCLDEHLPATKSHPFCSSIATKPGS